MINKKVGIIGFGNMGSAIAERIKSEYKVFVFDKDKERTTNLSGISVAENITDLLHKVDTVILAVKPQDIEALLKEIKDKVNNQLVISIAAGITTKYIEKILGMVRVIRVMPNIGVIVGKSIYYICKGEFAKEKDLKL
jgi:pyrroline-5-carboxylate reductase